MTKYKNKHILTISKKCIYFLKVGDNMLYDYLVNNYEKGEPIFLMDIVIKGMTEEDMKKCGKILTNYANEHRITREQVDKLLAYYPLKIYKAIYETGVKYVSA